MKLGLQIAARFLKSNVGQTILIVLGIGIGVSVQVFLGSLIQGLQTSLLDKTIGDSSQITITYDIGDTTFEDYDSLMEKVKKSDATIKTINAVLDNPAFLQIEDTSISLLVRGFDIDKADEIYQIKDKVVEGSLPKNEGDILLGTGLKEEYDLKVGDEITIITSGKESITCTITGFFDFQVAAINETWGVMTREAAQSIFNQENKVTSLEMQLVDGKEFSADVVAENIMKAIDNKDYVVSNWKAENEQLLSGLQGQSTSSYMIQVFVLISVIIGIASVLAVTVLQKSKQIGILKAMGMRSSTACWVFLFEGLILGLFGAILGVSLGLGLSAVFTNFALNPDGTPIVPLYINYGFIAISGVIAVLVSVIAAFFPALRSSKLNPIDIIRNN